MSSQFAFLNAQEAHLIPLAGLTVVGLFLFVLVYKRKICHRRVNIGNTYSSATEVTDEGAEDAGTVDNSEIWETPNSSVSYDPRGSLLNEEESNNNTPPRDIYWAV